MTTSSAMYDEPFPDCWEPDVASPVVYRSGLMMLANTKHRVRHEQDDGPYFAVRGSNRETD